MMTVSTCLSLGLPADARLEAALRMAEQMTVPSTPERARFEGWRDIAESAETPPIDLLCAAVLADTANHAELIEGNSPRRAMRLANFDQTIRTECGDFIADLTREIINGYYANDGHATDSNRIVTLAKAVAMLRAERDAMMLPGPDLAAVLEKVATQSGHEEIFDPADFAMSEVLAEARRDFEQCRGVSDVLDERFAQIYHSALQLDRLNTSWRAPRPN